MDNSLNQKSHIIASSFMKRSSLVLLGIGFLILGIQSLGIKTFDNVIVLSLVFGLVSVGSLFYFVGTYLYHPAGVNNNKIWFNSLTGRGVWGWVLGVLITGFYILLYWYSFTLETLIRMMDPIAYAIRGSSADQWFLYGSFYTFAILIMGIRALMKYRHSRYHLVRTSVIIFFQLVFAYLIPNFLKAMQQPEYYFSYFWPLKPEYLFPSTIYSFQSTGALGQFMVFWGVLMSFVAVPILTYFFGKRWYCSWVCGCGGLANTLGDPWRQLSDNSLKSWKIERWMIHSVLVIVTFTTILLWVNSFLEGGILGSISHSVSKAYGFFIGAIFSGVIGVGFYPILGTRVWCRFGCPQAAILGIIQKYFSRFRITTNGGQCISCGNCSTYCEMGIDVRSYAQKGQNIVRASCVGCGICSTVCPRGVLKLENGPVGGRV